MSEYQVSTFGPVSFKTSSQELAAAIGRSTLAAGFSEVRPGVYRGSQPTYGTHLVITADLTGTFMDRALVSLSVDVEVEPQLSRPQAVSRLLLTKKLARTLETFVEALEAEFPEPEEITL